MKDRPAIIVRSVVRMMQETAFFHKARGLYNKKLTILRNEVGLGLNRGALQYIRLRHIQSKINVYTAKVRLVWGFFFFDKIIKISYFALEDTRILIFGHGINN